MKVLNFSTVLCYESSREHREFLKKELRSIDAQDVLDLSTRASRAIDTIGEMCAKEQSSRQGMRFGLPMATSRNPTRRSSLAHLFLNDVFKSKSQCERP